MQEREAWGHYGAKLLLYQCPTCRGLWLDQDVVFAVSRDSALEAETEVALDEISIQRREAALYCPRCEVFLTEHSGGGLPPGLHIDYCTTCQGFWFDKGELMLYKSYLEKKRGKSKQRLIEDEARKRKERALHAAAQIRLEQPIHAYRGMTVAKSLITTLIDLWI
jgi:Zn-finger nucleic acid-binding protein